MQRRLLPAAPNGNERPLNGVIVTCTGALELREELAGRSGSYPERRGDGSIGRACCLTRAGGFRKYRASFQWGGFSHDLLMPVEGCKDTAANIPGPELRIIPRMGHDIPLALVQTFADAITATASRAHC